MRLTDLISDARIPYGVLERRFDVDRLLYRTLALPFDMELQTQINWCWAATSKSVSTFYRPSSTWTQCRIASAELGRTDCCSAPVPGACNVAWYLDRALTRTDTFERITAGPLSIAELRSELEAGRVVGARQQWASGGGHFMIIYGWSQVGSTHYLHIDDPIYGKSQPSLATFSATYQGSGTWTHSYFTKRPTIVKWLGTIPLSAKYLRKIWDVRPLLVPPRPQPDPPPWSSALAPSIAHPVFNVGLDALRKLANAAPDASLAVEKNSSIRVLEIEDETPRAFYDLTDAEDPEVLQFAGPSPYLTSIAAALAAAVAHGAHGNTKYALAMLRVPALYVDALWLRSDEPGKEGFIPVHAPFLGVEQRFYSSSDFLALLTKAAVARADDDDESGA